MSNFTQLCTSCVVFGHVSWNFDNRQGCISSYNVNWRHARALEGIIKQKISVSSLTPSQFWCLIPYFKSTFKDMQKEERLEWIQFWRTTEIVQWTSYSVKFRTSMEFAITDSQSKISKERSEPKCNFDLYRKLSMQPHKMCQNHKL